MAVPNVAPATDPDRAAVAVPDVVTLAGVRYREVTVPTFRNDIWLMREAREAGITDVAVGASSTQSDEPEAIVARVLARALEGDHMVRLLAGFLVEDGATWSRESAVRNAEFFANLTDPADKEQLQALFLAWLARFFVGAASSLVALLRSSPQTSDGAAEPTGIPSSARRPEERTSETGRSSFVRSATGATTDG
jgi:hypothetical protein